MITIGLLQSDIQPHMPEENFQHIDVFLNNNLTKHLDLLILPEMFSYGFSSDMNLYTENINGISVRFLKKIAKRYGTDIVTSIPIQEGESLHNRLFWISKEGEICGTYDKRHLFLGTELKHASPGNQRTIIERFGWKFLPLICYDVRFPIWSRNHLASDHFDYDCLIYTANFPAPREKTLLTLAQARAIENQAYVLVVNRIGKDGEGHDHVGGTAVISPQGEIIQSAPENQEFLLVQSLELDSLNLFRQKFPVAKQWDY